jgi:sulfur relay protein TusD/DsrE
VKFLVVVTESPWGSALSLSAWRFVKAAIDSKIQVSAVFFREEGVYNAVPGEAVDAGTPDLAAAWAELAAATGIRLLMCSSSRLRRLGGETAGAFQTSGLTELIELTLDSDRVVTF